ncbi:TonB-dependent receptor [Altererythrobacter aquiaggeris]|uniref:TonB-dependent receptor n=1 Tax=Aestuarierythrobacter aquiaggeris TaxID=1898396 RepID=UPI003019E2CA
MSSAAAASLLVGMPAYAQQQPAEPDAESLQDDFHDRRAAGEIIVTGVGLDELDVLAGTSVMEGVELQRNMAGQIGDVLAKLPGVSASSFSPGASRPILRGFSGERVKVLVDGIGSIDVSNTSVDHAVTVDPLTADRIEVLRGPAVLLYGSQAIGGAVNIIDKRIPPRRPDEPVHIDAIAGADTAYDLREFGGSVDLPLGNELAFHFDASWRQTNDFRIAGNAVAPQLRADLLAEAQADEADDPEEAAELRAAALQSGTVPNSATETFSAGAGIALFSGGNELGFALGIYDTAYGIPARPGAGHAHDENASEAEEPEGEERVSIDLRQTRADLRGLFQLGGLFEEARLRLGYSDYTHTEFEGDEVGTVFDVSGFEGRAELVQQDRNGWRGTVGGQFYYRDFGAEGAEAYVAPNITSQYALFALQEFDVGQIQLELAGRWDRSDVRSQTLAVSRSFDSFSGALGAAYETNSGLRFGVNASRAERAPSAEELFSNGPHIATQAFEIGDTALSAEHALGLEGFVRGAVGPASVSVAVFSNWFSDYIYLSETGASEDGLPVFQYLQGDADYYGLEGEVKLPLVSTGSWRLDAELRGDYVNAKLKDGTPLPRIPPVSLLGALEGGAGGFDGRIEVQWSAQQKQTAPFETRTGSFAFVNASLAWKPIRGKDNVTFILQADNIFDITGRRHASFTKDFVPLAGRNIKLSARASF